MGKRCFTFTQCEFERHCAHSKVDPRQGYFQPPHTGEHCPYYELATTAYDHHDEVIARMGAHE